MSTVDNNQELKCPICGEPTYLVYGKNPRKDRLCGFHSQQLFNKLILQCSDCGKWIKKDEVCECKKVEEVKNSTELIKKYTELPTEGFDKCVICEKSTNGYAFCRNCFKEHTEDELLSILNSFSTVNQIKSFEKNHFEEEILTSNYSEQDNSQEVIINLDEEDYIRKICLVCKNDSGEYLFCRTCFSKYRGKSLLFKIKVAKNHELELLDESYEGLYPCEDGHIVKSIPEQVIDDYLFDKGIKHGYELPIRDTNDKPLKPDFCLKNYLGNDSDGKDDVYLEYFGIEGSKDYDRKTQYKLGEYEKLGLTVVCMYNKTDSKNLKWSLRDKLDKKRIKKNEINYRE